jgi:SpoIID/LytB domain protein
MFSDMYDYVSSKELQHRSPRLECKNFSNNKIKVQGYGEMGLRDYLKGLGEMFSSWGDTGGYEAFKAQVVAAASYAFSQTNGGENEICTTQSCQVYIGHNKGGKWDESVDDVNNKCGDGVEVMVSNDTNNVVTGWYSSTFGGYSLTAAEKWGGDRPWTKHIRDASGDVNSFSDLNERAYDKESPWFYCDWGARAQYNKTAWLKPDEVADIANALLLAKSDPSTQTHLAQPDKPNPDGVDTWSPDKVKSELRSRGRNPINNVSDVSISWDTGGGRTTSISISGDGSSYSFDGSEFKNFFNLRAPANIQIVGPLFNVEKK